jgi:hypothetical protein
MAETDDRDRRAGAIIRAATAVRRRRSASLGALVFAPVQPIFFPLICAICETCGQIK